jgi:dipeptidyl aminopeptidase/acylaminoacyl peptidase
MFSSSASAPSRSSRTSGLADADFQRQRRLTEANPQQSDYNWGTAELMTWTSADGEELQGILYKPENFDPSRSGP